MTRRAKQGYICCGHLRPLPMGLRQGPRAESEALLATLARPVIKRGAMADLPKALCLGNRSGRCSTSRIHAVVGHWALHPCTTPVPDKMGFAPARQLLLRCSTSRHPWRSRGANPCGLRRKGRAKARPQNRQERFWTAEHSDAGPKGESQGRDEQFRSRRNCGQMLGPGSTDRPRTPWRIADSRYFTRWRGS